LLIAVFCISCIFFSSFLSKNKIICLILIRINKSVDHPRIYTLLHKTHSNWLGLAGRFF
jgi:hypothetical protein